jgi:hypothetical protein
MQKNTMDKVATKVIKENRLKERKEKRLKKTTNVGSTLD